MRNEFGQMISKRLFAYKCMDFQSVSNISVMINDLLSREIYGLLTLKLFIFATSTNVLNDL